MNATHHTQVRPPAVAGLFYPGDAATLRRLVEDLLADAAQALDVTTLVPPKAMIAPHAGYMYSGPIAASAYARLAALPDATRRMIRRVVLIGPSHRVRCAGVAAPGADAFATPLAELPIDRDAVAALRQRGVTINDAAHAKEHSLEVHLPFLVCSLPGPFAIVPLVFSDTDGHEVARLLESVWGGPETLVVVSSDLSHYHDYDTARAIDRRTAEAIEHLAGDELHEDQACGRLAIQGALEVARRRGLHVRAVDLRNSGDTAGRRDHVVGYGAFLFS